MSRFFEQVVRDPAIINMIRTEAERPGTNQATLVTFPKTGRNLCQVIIELYYGRQVVTRSYFIDKYRHAKKLKQNEHNDNWFGTVPWMPIDTRYLLFCDHDIHLDRAFRYPIITVRDPVDSVYSYCRFNQLGTDTQARHAVHLLIGFWRKWLVNFKPPRKTIVSFAKLAKGDKGEYHRLLSHYNCPIHTERMEWVRTNTTKDKMAQLINQRVPQFVNMSDDYANNRTSFREKWQDEIWNRVEKEPQVAAVLAQHGIQRAR